MSLSFHPFKRLFESSEPKKKYHESLTPPVRYSLVICYIYMRPTILNTSLGDLPNHLLFTLDNYNYYSEYNDACLTVGCQP